ncbi:MAG TPA: calcium-binding protein [Baekduia sp.]|nr:calcium-binding protein [Baekduia sp.]
MPYRLARTRLSLLVAVAALTAVAVPAARAGTLTASGTTVTYTAAPGEKNFLTVNWGNGAGGPSPPVFTDHVDITTGAGCEEIYAYSYDCPGAGAHPTVIVRLGDQDDIAESSNAQAAGNHVELYGEDGNDQLESDAGTDTLDGGPGDDTLSPDDGDEGPGDVVRGGPGTDLLQLAGTLVPALTATLDDVADDGPPGEHDNYASDIENVTGSKVAANTITGTNGPNEILGADLTDTLTGLGGDDHIEGYDQNDRIDGGDGADRLVGGSGDDTIIGGGGVDSIDGDGVGAWGQVIAGNDTINARDGLAEPINCGLATDTAILDPTDTVPADPTTACENIDRGPAAPAPPPGGGGGGTASAAKPAITSTSLRYRDGRVALIVSCPAAATATCAGTLRARTASKVRVGQHRKTVTVLSASYSVEPGQRRTLKLRPTSAGRTLLRRSKTLKLAVELRAKGAKTATATKRLTVRR